MKVTSLKPLNSICYALGILPTSSANITKCENQRIWSDYIHGILFIAVSTSLMLYNVYGKFYIFGGGMYNTILLTYVLADVILTLINVLSILLINIYYGKQVMIFFNTLTKLETFIVSQETVSWNERKFKIQFHITNLCVQAFIIFNGYQWISDLGWDIYKFFLFCYLQHYHVFITFWLLAQYANLIGWRMKDLNEHLKNVVSKENNFPIAIYRQASKNGNKVNLRIISEAYTTIAELVRSYNTIFGPIYIVMNMNLVISILVPLNMGLLQVRDKTLLPENLHGDVSAAMIPLCTFWLSFPCIFGIMIFSACNSAANEAGKVPDLCYALLRQIPDNDCKLRDDLERYANQAHRLKPCFSAAGFFDINNGLTFPVFGSVISYTIILMQLH